MLPELASDLGRYMDLLSARQKLVASNIANADTPGYQTQDIDFQFEFVTMLNEEKPQTIRPRGLKQTPDGNNVDLDREARLLAEDAIRFNVASNLLRGQIKAVQQAIQGGGNP